MTKIIKLKVNRDYYDINDCVDNTLSVAEVIEILSRCPSDAKVVFSNDNGYTYGNLDNNTIKFTHLM